MRMVIKNNDIDIVDHARGPPVWEMVVGRSVLGSMDS
jgi:hypothetical protein